MSLLNNVLKQLKKQEQDLNSSSCHEQRSYQFRNKRSFTYRWFSWVRLKNSIVFIFLLILLSIIFYSVFNYAQYQKRSSQNVVLDIASPIDNSAEDPFYEVNNEIARNHYEKALAILSDMINQNPKNTEAQRLKIVVLAEKGELSKAHDILNLALSNNSIDEDLQYAKSYLLYAEEDYKAAETELTLLHPIIAGHVDYYSLLAQVNLQLAQYNEAKSLYRLLLDEDPKNPKLWLGLALSLKALNRTDDATVAFKQALHFKGLSVSVIAYIDHQLQGVAYSASV